MQQHPVFIRGHGKKAIVVTVIDTEEFGLPEEFRKNDSFIIANTGASVYTNFNPTMIFDMSTLQSPESYLKSLNNDSEDDCRDMVKGNSIGGIVTEPLWWIKKFKSVFDMMS